MEEKELQNILLSMIEKYQDPKIFDLTKKIDESGKKENLQFMGESSKVKLEREVEVEKIKLVVKDIIIIIIFNCYVFIIIILLLLLLLF